jgi:hypothetical protein
MAGSTRSGLWQSSRKLGRRRGLRRRKKVVAQTKKLV